MQHRRPNTCSDETLTCHAARSPYDTPLPAEVSVLARRVLGSEATPRLRSCRAEAPIFVRGSSQVLAGHPYGAVVGRGGDRCRRVEVLGPGRVQQGWRGESCARRRARRSIPLARRARGDHAVGRGRGRGARDRPCAGSRSGHDQPRSRPPPGQPRLPGFGRSSQGRARSPAAAGGETGHQPGVAPRGPGPPRAPRQSPTDRWQTQGRLPRRTGDVGVGRDDLPVAVCAGPRRAQA